MLLDLVGIASEREKVSTNSEGIIEVGGAKGVENSKSTARGRTWRGTLSALKSTRFLSVRLRAWPRCVLQQM